MNWKTITPTEVITETKEDTMPVTEFDTSGKKIVEGFNGTTTEDIKNIVDNYAKNKPAKKERAPKPTVDLINHPPHYTAGGVETIDFIEAKNLGYNLGNVVKYITRADHKGNKIEDLQKAQWYLNREIAKIK